MNLCAICNDTGKILLLYSYVECECQTQKTPSADEILNIIVESSLSDGRGITVRELRKKLPYPPEVLRGILNELVDGGKIEHIAMFKDIFLIPKKEKNYHILGRRMADPQCGRGPATYDDLSKQELRNELLRLKMREKKLKAEQQLKANKLILAAQTMLAQQHIFTSSNVAIDPADFMGMYIPLLPFMRNISGK